jgi:ubiquinone/menaquinone biosynthesis C-methylase UbiE
MDHSDEIIRLKDLYTHQYPLDGEDPNYIWHPRNPVSIYYRQAQERSLVSMLNTVGLRLKPLRVLDVGCGSGSLLRFFVSLGSDPSLMYGVDLIPTRLNAAGRQGPHAIHYSACNAQYLPFEDASFDLACLFTVFSSIFDQDLRRQIAREISRILSDSGYLLWYDMCYTRSTNTQPISTTQIYALFPDFQPVYCKKIHSPWISRLVKRSYLLCEIIDHLSLLRRTHNLCLLRKRAG